MGVQVIAAVLLYRALRLFPFITQPDGLFLTERDLRIGARHVPWEDIEDVVLFNLALWPRGPGVRNFLAVRVRDYGNVNGMSDLQISVANLTRRHLLVLCQASKVRHPAPLADALRELVNKPESRRLLGTVEGRRLVGKGQMAAARPTSGPQDRPA